MKTSAIAKITRPQVSGVLLRERLFRLIDSRPDRPILWVCGPAGSGKTTLTASYLDFQRRHCLWYQVDEGDGDIATFFHYLGLAAKKAVPRRRQRVPIFSPEYLPGLPVFAKRYFEELFNRLLASAARRDDRTQGEYFLVFDNYQEAPPGAALHDLMPIGLDTLPPGIKVVIISREEPPPQYARLRANEKIAVLGWDDLCFTRDESSKILDLPPRKKNREYDLELLFSRSRGWAAGLVLFNESLKAGDIGLPFLKESPPPEGIFEYFAGEVYTRLEKDIRDFLVKTSFLPQMTPHSAGAIADTDKAASILNNLSRRNCFTEKRALPHLTYQYHPLFREFLLSKAGLTFSRKDLLRLKRQAARLLEKSDQIKEAVSLLLQEEDWDELVPVLCAHVPSFLAQGRGKTVQEWLLKIPEKILAEHLGLTYYLGICRMPFNPAEGLALFETTFRKAHKQGDYQLALAAWSEAVNTILYGWNDFTVLDTWIEWLEKRVKAGLIMPSREIEAKVAISMSGALMFRRPDRPEAIRNWVKRALSLTREIKDANLQAQTICYSLQYYGTIGDAANNDAAISELRSIPSSAIISPTAVITLKWIEAVACNWRQADPDAGLRLINEGLRFAEANGLHTGDHFLFAVGAYCALLKGDMAMAGDFLRRIEETLDNTRFHSFCQYNYIAALYHFLQDDVPAAQHYAESALKYALETGVYFPVLYCRLALAHISLEGGEHDQSALHLAAADGPVRKTGSGILEYSWLLARARLSLDTGANSEGLHYLRRAMQLARKNGYTWLFWWWHPENMARLCACALKYGIEVKYIQKIIRTCNLKPAAHAAAPENWPYPLKIRVLGGFEIIRDGEPLRFSGKVPQKPLEMLKALIALGGINVREEQLTEILWPEADGDAAHKSFEVNLVRLRKLAGGQQCIICQSGLVSIEATYCRVDALVFGNFLQDAEKSWIQVDRHSGDPPPEWLAETVQKTEKVIDMYSGNFLPADTHHPWTIAYRELLRSRTLQLLARLGTHHQKTGSWENALACYLRGLEIDELSEEFYQQLMICRHQLGQNAEAVTTYNRCRQALSHGLGIQPSAKTEAILRKIADL